MALVSYDYDSTSDTEEDDSTPSSVVIIPKNTESNKEDTLEVNGASEETESKQTSLFATLPESKHAENAIVEDQIEDFIPKPEIKKEKQKVRITIPSLSEFHDSDEEEPDSKKFKPSSKGSGLISLLPPVKGSVKTSTCFIPKVIANKAKTPATSTKPSTNTLIPHSVRKNTDKTAAVTKKTPNIQKSVGAESDDDDDIEIPETFDDEMWEKVCARPKNKKIIQESSSEPQGVINIAPEPEKPYEGLDNKAFKELIGKMKRPVGNIKLIDINEEEILADKDLWMAKAMTDPEMAPKATVEDPVDPTKRKKHHITYLAQQAKANEQDLKTAWAISKNNRLASRSKYGF